MRKKPVMLIILDGFGKGVKYPGNAVENAQTPILDRLFSEWNSCYLETSGLHVGLPEGQMGNSEVGHLNIGGGRVVFQDLPMINNDIEDGSFFQRTVLLETMDSVKKKNSKLHLIGLCSKGGVHSHLNHLKALLRMAKNRNLSKVFVHAITDGRDVATNAAQNDLAELQEYMNSIGIGQIATISGRYYAMDRDKRWDRIQQCYDNMVSGKGVRYESSDSLLTSSYASGVTDEFIPPSSLDSEGFVSSGDGVIFFNFRPDRGRELTRAFVDDVFTGFDREKIDDLTFATMTEYDADIQNVKVVYAPEIVPMTLSEFVSGLGKKQLKIAETEKYAHVTFFFNGGLEQPNVGEDRILVNSPKDVATYDLKPEMSAYEVSDKLCEAIRSKKYDAIIVNFANPDMVGHTGSLEAATKAVEVVDECLGKAIEAMKEVDGAMFVCADHGNCEQLIDYNTGEAFTAHTINPVPFILVNAGEGIGLKEGGRLCDIAPTLLDLMDIEKPAKMTGESLLVKNV